LSNICKTGRSGNQEDLPAENDGDVADKTLRKKEVQGSEGFVKKTICNRFPWGSGLAKGYRY